MITIDNLISLGVNKRVAAAYEHSLMEAMNKYSINTFLRICHFLAQVLHESAMLNIVHENLNYRADALVKIFPHHFDIVNSQKYAHTPVKIANHLYANRMGNGDENSSDGWRYSGKGPLQITGKANYMMLEAETGMDCVTHPELLLDPAHGCLAAGWFWNSRQINHKADVDDLIGVTKLVNGGLIGIEDRRHILGHAKEIFKTPHI